MSGLGAISTGGSGGASSTLQTDQAAAKTADAAAVKAAAHLASDKTGKAAQGAITADQQTLKTVQAAATKADTRVVSDRSTSRGINVTA